VPGQTLIIGCGYVGLPLALELQRRGHAITAWVHSAATAASLAPHRFSRIVTGSVADESAWEDAGGDCDLAIHCASSGKGGEVAYDEVFVKGATRMNEFLSHARKIFVSSTSVYGQTQGEIVTEQSPAGPVPATGKILRVAEMIALEGGASVVRSSGIYGPGRGVLFAKFQRGEAVVEGDGQRWLNQIHQRDLVLALEHLIAAGVPGEIYNATDDTPVTQRDFYAWCAEFLGQPLPPPGPMNLQRKRGLTNKRVSNAKLRTTGWAPIYPSFREGLAADHSPR
jgi:nucleoside-diphosphate-sugar epimerase